jgi:hypothetical protein
MQGAVMMHIHCPEVEKVEEVEEDTGVFVIVVII